MTAEIVIANQGAVALAADSAVTIGGEKIYNSALKLFSLSKTEPIGVMIYGNANLMSVPWETIIKTYRKELGRKAFPTVKNYLDDFVTHLEKKKYFSKEDQNRWIKTAAKIIYGNFRTELEEKVEKILEDKNEVTNQQTQDLFNGIVTERHAKWKNSKLSDRHSKSSVEAIRKASAPIFDEVIKEIFEILPITKSMRRKLHDLVTFAITSDASSSGSQSGIVIAGFGTEEYFPSIQTASFDGVVGDKPKCFWQESHSKDIKETGSTIIPFAQQEMVHTFIQGVDPNLSDLQDQYLGYLFERLPELLDFKDLRISKQNQEIVREDLKKKTEELYGKIQQQLVQIRIEKNVHPVISMVSALPKDELAAMAESLVNLTAFKRKMTKDLETVGGPIDVAVISKGDGLVWVKRKHYFPAELNNHFYQNYFRDLDQDE